jgi:hypothetical protein
MSFNEANLSRDFHHVILKCCYRKFVFLAPGKNSFDNYSRPSTLLPLWMGS